MADNDYAKKEDRWEEDFTDQDRLIAASVSPQALAVKLDEQYCRSMLNKYGEYACKASAAKKKRKPKSKFVTSTDPNAIPKPGDDDSNGGEAEVVEPSMWKSGGEEQEALNVVRTG